MSDLLTMIVGGNGAWRELGVEPPPLSGEPTPENARLILEGRRRYLSLSSAERAACQRRADEIEAKQKRGEVRSFAEIVEAQGPLVTVRYHETPDLLEIDLFDVPADLYGPDPCPPTSRLD